MPLKTHQDAIPELNLTPMIDIVFLLIIFFMVGTKFAEMERTVALEVPRVSQLGALSPTPPKFIVNVYRDGTISVDQQTVSLAELTAHVRQGLQGHPERALVVRGDADGTFQNVASVLTACREAGVRDLGISVQLGQKQR